jgi:hypothetical protein
VSTDLGQSVSPNGAATPLAEGHQPTSSLRGSAAAPRLIAPGRHRGPAIWGLGLALVMGGGAVAAATTMAAGDRSPVLTVVRPVDAGTTISARDLGQARIAADPQLDPIPADQRRRVVGQVAGVDLRPGTLLTASQLDAVAVPGPEQALVGVALTPGRLPARELQRGDRVLAVITAADVAVGGSAPAGADPPATLAAEVVSTGHPASDGTVVVDLLVAEADAAVMAADSAAERISLVLLPRAQ